jgi:ankyrin repeat protein
MKGVLGFLLLISIFITNCISGDKMQGHANIADLAYSGDVYTISIEVSKGFYIDERDSFQKKYTALMVASREGDYRLAEWLIEHGANVNAKTRDGHTALMYACYNRYPEIVKLLLKKGADVHLKSTQGHTALTEIMETEKESIVEALLGAGAKEEKIK